MKNNARKRITPAQRTRAKILRHEASPAERKLWRELDPLKTKFHMRRQQVIAGYIADIVCHKCKLIIEIDGFSHEGRMDYDYQRTAILNKEGYEIVRFANEDVMENAEGVVLQIETELMRRDPPTNLPHKGGG
jgi:very-short-patch-repair endonuclease